MVIHHKDSDRRNNRPHNLAVVHWERNQEYINWCRDLNCEDAHLAGFTAFFIRMAVLDAGHDVVDVSRRFGVRPDVVAGVVAGHVYPDEAHI
jgi:hypothetical protein